MEEWKPVENRRVRTCWGHARIAIFCFSAFNMIMSLVGLGLASYAYATGKNHFKLSWNAELMQAVIAGCVILFLVNVGLVVSMFWRVLILMDFWLLYHLFIFVLLFGLSGIHFMYGDWLILLSSIFIQIINWYAVKVVYHYYLKVKEDLDSINKPRVTFQVTTQ